MPTIDDRRRAILASLSQPSPPPMVQRHPVPLSVDQTPMTGFAPRQITPVSIPGVAMPDQSATSFDGVFGGGVPTVTIPQNPLTAVQAADIRRRASAAVQ